MSLVRGLTLEQAKDVVVKKAQAAVVEGGQEIGIWTETGNAAVLVGVATREGHACAMLIPIEKYDGIALLEKIQEQYGGKRSGVPKR